MSASLINFESARVKEERRQQDRKAREAILEKAQQEFEVRQQKEEAARQRGEHKWMLPSVEAKLTQDQDSAKKKKKKKDKKKKKKKEKKAKKSKRKDSSSSSSESEEDGEGEGVWVESSTSTSSAAPMKAPSPQPLLKGPQLPGQDRSSGETVKRDGWMEMTSLFGTFSRDEMREREGTSRKKAKEEEERKKREAAKPGSHALELNPYYKNGGTGLPEEQQQETAQKAAGPQTTGLDAGWLRRALQRAKEQASAEGKSLEEIATQRWGSLARFNELLAEAEGRGKHRENDPRSQDRRRERRSRSRERDRMRNRSRERDRRRSRSRDRDRNKSRSISEERERSRGVRKNRSRSRDRRDRSRDRARQDRSRERRRHRGRRSSSSGSSSSSSSSSRSSSRSNSRNRSKQGGRKEDRHSREGSPRFSQKLLKPPEESSKSSALSMRFQKPGEDTRERSSSKSTQRGSLSSSSSSSNNRWQKKGYQQPVREQQQAGRRSPSPSSSSTSSSSEDEAASQPPKTTTAGQGEAPLPTQLPAPAPPTPLTDKEMNELAAKIMKAELMGNDAQATKLKARLEAAREVRATGAGSGGAGPGESSSPTEKVVVLTRTDSRGVSRPVLGAEAESGKGRRRTKVKTHGQDGQRARYFPDDDQHSLKHMFEREKGTTADDQNAMFEDAAMKNIERLNDDYDIDDMFMSKAALRDSAAKQADRDKKKAIQEHQRVERSLESCHWCFDNKEMPKHLIVSLGKKCYVSLPVHQSLTPGHCCITPIHHVSCCVQAEEDLWDEVQSFRKSLVKMFASRGEDCIFFETVKRLRHFPHMVLHCVPLPREIGDMAPIYFKKAIMECEREWAQNKKLVELKGRDVRRAVPKGLPYFFVDFAMDAGFAHVIEDEQDFPNNFAQEIVGGMLDLDSGLWRKPRRENFDTQRRKVMEFSRWYKEFDPTQEG